MPGPPPPPPPPPSAGPTSNIKNAVLKDIVKGSKLRKVPDNEKRDRSAPTVDSNSASSNAPPGSGSGSRPSPVAAGNPFQQELLNNLNRNRQKAGNAPTNSGITLQKGGPRPPPPSQQPPLSAPASTRPAGPYAPPSQPRPPTTSGPFRTPGPPPPPPQAPVPSQNSTRPTETSRNSPNRVQQFGTMPSRQAPLPSNPRPNPNPPGGNNSAIHTWNAKNSRAGGSPSNSSNNAFNASQTMGISSGNRPLPAPPPSSNRINNNMNRSSPVTQSQSSYRSSPQGGHQHTMNPPGRPLPPQPPRPPTQPPPPPSMPPPVPPGPPRPPKTNGQKIHQQPPPAPPPPPMPNGQRANGGIQPEEFERRFKFPDQRLLPQPPRYIGGSRTYPSAKQRPTAAPPALPIGK